MEAGTHTGESLRTTSDDLHDRIEQFRPDEDDNATLDDVDESAVDADL